MNTGAPSAALPDPLPPPDANAPIGSAAHKVWFYSVQVVCGELVHQCGMTPPRPCVPCLKPEGHERGHALWWDYEKEYGLEPTGSA